MALFDPSTIGSVIGGIGGGIAGGIGGGPVGAIGGASAGSAVGASVGGLFEDTPQAQGPTGAQKSALSISQDLTGRAAAQRGLNAQQVSNLSQAAAVQSQEQLMALNTLAQQNFSPLERQMITKRLMSDVRSGQVDQLKALQNFDVEAETRNIALTGQLNSQAAQEAARHQQVMRQQEEAMRQREAIKLQNFNNALSSAVQTIGLLGKMNSIQQAEQAKDVAKLDEQFAADNQVLGTAKLGAPANNIDLTLFGG